MDDKDKKDEPSEKVETKAEETEEEIEISPSVMKELNSTIEEAVSKTVQDEVAKAIQSLEKVVDKGIGGSTPSADVKDELETMSKEVRFVKGLRAMMQNDFETLRQHNKYAITKAGYQNETTNADGGFLVPDPDFIAEVARLEEQYGVAQRDARVITVRSDSLKINKKDSGVTMYETSEAGAKTGTKMTFGQDTVVLRKFAGIAAVTDELNEDAAVAIFNELSTDFARESARIKDTLVFTDATSGISVAAGTAAVAVGATIDLIDFDDLNLAVYSVPTQSMQGGKFYLHRTILGIIQRIKDTTDNYIWQPGTNGVVNGTIWGFPYELVEVLPDIAHVGDANEPYIIFGNLKYSVLIQKAGLQLTTLKEATIADSDGNTVNLARQDMTGLRAVMRANNLVQFPEAFCLIGTGTVS